jgi:hypothetical protein
MSVYDGQTIGEAEYASGRDEGRLAADSLAEHGSPFLAPALEDEGRENVRTASADRSRAYYLGWLRGFRSVTRHGR